MFGVKPNGEHVLIGKTGLTPKMKYRELICSYNGFLDDDDYDGMECMFEEFIEWQKANGYLVDKKIDIFPI